MSAFSSTADGGGVFGVETITLDLPPLVSAFGRRLHEAGIPVTSERAAAFAEALSIVRPIRKRRLYWTARVVFVTDDVQVPDFDRAFWSVFGEPTSSPSDADELERSVGAADDRPRSDLPSLERELDRRTAGVGISAASGADSDEGRREAEVPSLVASDEERLQAKRFDALEPAELAAIYRMIARLQLATPIRRARRFEKRRYGERIDLRRTLRGSLRTGGDPIRLRRRRRRLVPRRLVMLCDISGSMEPYARVYLQFLTCARRSGPNAEAFVFATRLTRLTRALSSRNPGLAIERAAAAAPDWSSGTRIGDALREFNDRHGRRGMARGAVIVIISDGWERDDPQLVGQEMERLARLAHRIVWVNPRVAARSFSVRSGGMRAALPHCDALVAGHSFAALDEVVEAIGAQSIELGETLEPRHLDQAAPDSDTEPWASATPVAGSSVAMPSGHGPSRGKTTPGW